MVLATEEAEYVLSKEVWLNHIKEILRSQKYEADCGIHVTSFYSALQIAFSGHIRPSELSARVDVEIVRAGRKPSLVIYSANEYPVVIEISPHKVTGGGEGPSGGMARDPGKSYVSIDDAKFHTIDGIYSRKQFTSIFQDAYERMTGKKHVSSETKGQEAREAGKMSYEEWQKQKEIEEIEASERFLASDDKKESISKEESDSFWSSVEKKHENEELKDMDKEVGMLVAAEKQKQNEELRRMRRQLEDR